MLTLIDKYIHDEIPDLPKLKRVVISPDKLYFIYDSEYHYGRFPKSYGGKLFRSPAKIYLIKDIKIKNRNNENIFIVNYEVILHRTYFDHLIKEILIKILINLNTSKDIGNYLKVIEPVSTEPEFNRLWVTISKGHHQNPKHMLAKSHKLIADFVREYRTLLKNNVHIYDGDECMILRRIDMGRGAMTVSKITLNVYDEWGKYIGNLNDEPYHGFDLLG